MTPRILGWHEPGGLPQVRPSGEDPVWLSGATAYHENAHNALISASAHGKAQNILADISCTDPLQAERLDASQRALFSATFLTHEGSATLLELLYLEHIHLEAVQELWTSLPASYRIAVEKFDWILSVADEAQTPRQLAMLMISSVALCCSNTFIIDYAQQQGLIKLIERGLNDKWLNPDERLELLANLPKRDQLDLAYRVRDTIERVRCNRDSGLITTEDAAPIVDRTVEKWIHNHKIFKVAERIAHQHRWPVVARAKLMSYRDLRLTPLPDLPITTRRLSPFGEVVSNFHNWKTDQLQIFLLKEPDQFDKWVQIVSREGDNTETAPYFALALRRDSRSSQSSEHYSLYATAMWGSDESPATSTDEHRVQLISRPDQTASVCLSVTLSNLPISGVNGNSLAVPASLYLQLSESEKEKLFSYDLNVYVLVELTGESVIADIARQLDVASYQCYSSKLFGPNLVLMKATTPALFAVFFVSSYGVHVAEAVLEREGISPDAPESDLIPMEIYLGIWHWLFGLLAPRNIVD